MRARRSSAVRSQTFACGSIRVYGRRVGRESLCLLLQLAGHEVETSEDAAGTLEKVRVFQPDVALIDIGLPGMDGYRLAQALRERPHARDLRLIALTGYGQAEDQRKALEAGFDLHLTKPVDPDRLQSLIAGD